MCGWLGVSTSGFYEWRDRPASATARRRERLAALIQWIYDDSDGTYGHRRVHAALVRQGERCSPELVRAIMRELGLVSCQPRPFRPATTVAGDAAPAPDLVGRDFSADAPGTKLVGDITYIPTWQGWLYLATVIDCYSKKVIGCAQADDMRASLEFRAMRMAFTAGGLAAGGIFHTDRGSQFTPPTARRPWRPGRPTGPRRYPRPGRRAGRTARARGTHHRPGPPHAQPRRRHPVRRRRRRDCRPAGRGRPGGGRTTVAGGCVPTGDAMPRLSCSRTLREQRRRSTR